MISFLGVHTILKTIYYTCHTRVFETKRATGTLGRDMMYGFEDACFLRLYTPANRG